MKTIAFAFFWLLATQALSAQYYCYLGDLDTVSHIKRYTLKSKPLYPLSDNKIELLNVFLPRSSIALFSIFHSTDNSSGWKEADTSNLDRKVIDIKELELIVFDALDRLSKDNYDIVFNIKRADIIPLIKKENRFFISEAFTLLEFFYVKNDYYGKKIFPNENMVGVIDITMPRCTAREYNDMVIKAGRSNPFSVFNDFQIRRPIDVPRDFSSHYTYIKGEKAYHFWTLSGWSIFDGPNIGRGIERYVYIPDKGIVGGAYDFYFAYHGTFKDTKERMWQKRLNEEIMLAEELKE